MSEISEMWKDRREASRIKKSQNEKTSTDLLESYGVKFDVKNFGNHLIVYPDGLKTDRKQLIDFWPSTGLWIRRDGKRGRGVRNLLKHVNLLAQPPRGF